LGEPLPEEGRPRPAPPLAAGLHLPCVGTFLQIDNCYPPIVFTADICIPAAACLLPHRRLGKPSRREMLAYRAFPASFSRLVSPPAPLPGPRHSFAPARGSSYGGRYGGRCQVKQVNSIGPPGTSILVVQARDCDAWSWGAKRRWREDTENSGGGDGGRANPRVGVRCGARS